MDTTHDARRDERRPDPPTAHRARAARWRRGLAFAAALGTLPGGPALGTQATVQRGMALRYETAVSAFRQGDFARAYGHFAALAGLGHATSARHALWMCENGTVLLRRALDCAPHEIEDWATLGGIEAQPVLERIYPGQAPRVASVRRPR